jgi:hypothetical protein
MSSNLVAGHDQQPGLLALGPQSESTLGVRLMHDQPEMTTAMRLRTLLVAVSVAAAATGGAQASLFFLFSPTHAAHGDEVVIRTGGTPPSFDLGDRVRPFQPPITVYLVPEAVAATVRARTDPRLVPVGTLVPDKNGHGVLKFRVPQLRPGIYAVAARCPGCAAYSFGRSFFTFPDDPQIVPRYRMLMFLRIGRGGSSASWWWIISAVGFVALALGVFFARKRARARLSARSVTAPETALSGARSSPDVPN